MSGLRLRAIAGGVRFAIRVQPRSSKPGIGGLHGDALKVRVALAPVDGAANEAVVEVLADVTASLTIPRRGLTTSSLIGVTRTSR